MSVHREKQELRISPYEVGQRRLKFLCAHFGARAVVFEPDCCETGSAYYIASVPVQSSTPADIEQELQKALDDAYDENGVDRSLIRWSLAHTPTERVRAVEETLDALKTIRRVEPER